ncbi:MAG: EVE domain-containing protein [Thaumarchaeota archaeon]|nr:EVE domain-containing protein [Nitrososphaerota archaeon]MDE0265859.1 EVE domain-containing protein [Nitrososphaerota archaeon]MDE0525821.1 EVE domain-containing protein [Nitrososphaerota archaeon]
MPAGGKGGARRWILSVAPSMWRAIERNGAYATASVPEISKIRRGDRVAFYVLGTGRFNGIFEVSGKWHEPTCRWPVRVTDEAGMRSVRTGTATIRGMLPSLHLAKKSRWVGLHLHGGLANYGRPISASDYRTISEHMRRNPRLAV